MQFAADRLYIVTTDGSLTCIDASEAAITAAQAGTVPEVVHVKAPNPAAVLPSTTLETTSNTSQGVIVECFREGSQLRVRVVSPGYDPKWNVQFPKNIRTEGDRYLVDEVRESARGGFYRTFGNIQRLV
jgi:hypothetical protein